MTSGEPDDAEIREMLARAERESQRNAGADEFAAHAATLRARSRRAATRSMKFDMVATAFLALLVVLLAGAFLSTFNLG
jgi:hypothetical protein